MKNVAVMFLAVLSVGLCTAYFTSAKKERSLSILQEGLKNHETAITVLGEAVRRLYEEKEQIKVKEKKK